MQKIFKLFSVVGLTIIGLNACNSGGNSSKSIVVNGPYASTSPDQSLSNTCKFSSTNNICSVDLSYQANPPASLIITGVSTPYSIENNTCVTNKTNASCQISIYYTPQTTANTQTAVMSVGGSNYNLILTNNQ